MLFSERLDLAKKIDQLIKDNHIKPDILGIICALEMGSMLAIPIEAPVMQKIAEQCQWIKEDEEGVYETDCKHSFQFTSDGVRENHFNHWPNCGKPIIEIDLTENYGRLDEEADAQAEGT